MAWNIAIVVDPEYREEAINQLVRYHPIWIVDTPTNRACAEVAREAAGQIWDPEASCTTFRVQDPTDRECNSLSELETIDLHHPNMFKLELIGVKSSPSLVSRMKEFGFLPTHTAWESSVAFKRPVTALSNVPILQLDASMWNQIDDVYASIFEVLRSPSWHGRNFSALNDSIVTGGVNAVEVPYTLSVKGLKTAPSDVQRFFAEFVDFISEREADGCPISIQIEK